MSESQPSRTATKLAWRHYLGQLRRDKRISIISLLLPGIGSIFGDYVPPLVVAAAITRFGNHQPTLSTAAPYLAWFGGLWLLGEIIWRIAFLLLNATDSMGMRALYTTAMKELGRKDLQFFHNNFAGSLTKKAIAYGKNYEGFVDTLAFNVFAQLIPLAFAAVILWRYSPWLIVTLIVLMGTIAAIVIPLTRKRKILVDAREAASNAMAGHIADTIGNIDAVQAFAHEDFEQAQHACNVKDYMDKTKRSWDFHTLRIDSSISPMYVAINVIGLALAILLGKNAPTTAVIFVTFSYFSRSTRIFWEFNRIYRNIENAISEAAQFTQLLLEPPAIAEVPNPIAFKVTSGEISFDAVHFAYENHNKEPLFADFSLHVKPGEKIALVGHSGGGKTTITRLLLRFVDVQSGRIVIDGQDIAQAKLCDVRSSIAYVPQEPLMFHRTIHENIHYGRLTASGDEVIAAAKKANAHEFINALPQGYETLVGERGIKLSGGQRQRIAIARAILKDAPILVLDEATSALDSESEVLIQDALWKLMKNRTAIVIAHRLSTIQKMDRIIVLVNGAIAEQGTHKQLLLNKGAYAKLWGHQSGGFIEE